MYVCLDFENEDDLNKGRVVPQISNTYIMQVCVSFLHEFSFLIDGVFLELCHEKGLSVILKRDFK
jgi:hypothetical protein